MCVCACVSCTPVTSPDAHSTHTHTHTRGGHWEEAPWAPVMCACSSIRNGAIKTSGLGYGVSPPVPTLCNKGSLRLGNYFKPIRWFDGLRAGAAKYRQHVFVFPSGGTWHILSSCHSLCSACKRTQGVATI